MKNLIYTTLIVLILPLYAQAQPSVVFTEEQFNFGEIQQGQQAEHTFEFVNKGTADLVIERVSST